jgi:hypothetical protein
MSPIYRANCVVRDASGREVAARYPLWSGEAPTIAEAANAAREALAPHVADERAETAVVHVSDNKGGKVTFTEYASDVRAGNFVSADKSTLMADCEFVPEADRKLAIDELRRQAVDAMPELRAKAQAAKVAEGGETAPVEKDPLADFFGEGWSPTVKPEAEPERRRTERPLPEPEAFTPHAMTAEERARLNQAILESHRRNYQALKPRIFATPGSVVGVRQQAEQGHVMHAIEVCRQRMMDDAGVEMDEIRLGHRAAMSLARELSHTLPRVLRVDVHGATIYGARVVVDDSIDDDFVRVRHNVSERPGCIPFDAHFVPDLTVHKSVDDHVDNSYIIMNGIANIPDSTWDSLKAGVLRGDAASIEQFKKAGGRIV